MDFPFFSRSSSMKQMRRVPPAYFYERFEFKVHEDKDTSSDAKIYNRQKK